MYRDQEQRDFARSLRNQPTEPEKRLWHFLRAGKLRGQKFRRQAEIGAYVVDFVCFDLKLVIELDGPQHLENEAIEHDARRTEWLTGRGFQVIRFRNQELDKDIQLVLDSIVRAVDKLETARKESPLPNPPRRGEGAEPKIVRRPRGGAGPT